jgi:hypothetical protein
MRYVVAFLMAMLAQYAQSAELLIGTAVLKVQDRSPYRPCVGPVYGGVLCTDSGSWLRYEAEGFVDIKGQSHKLTSIVAYSLSPLSGEWFLVLERLSAEDAMKFGVQYKVVDSSAIIRAICLSNPIEKYTGDKFTTPKLAVADDLVGHCYNTIGILRK